MRQRRSIVCLILFFCFVNALPGEERPHGNSQAYDPFSQSRRQNRGVQQGQNGNNGQNGQGQQSNNNSGGGAGGGGGGGGGGDGSVEYKPREQDKLEETKKTYEADAKEMKENLKNYTTELGKMNQDLSKQIDKAKIPESDALLKEIAKESSDVVSMTGVAKDSANAEIGDLKTLGDTVAKGYLVQAQAFLNAPQLTPTPTPAAPSVGQEIASLTNSRPHGSAVGSSLDMPSSSKTSNLHPIKGPDAQLGGGEHASFGADRGPASVATSFNRGAIYNAPVGIKQK